MRNFATGCKGDTDMMNADDIFKDTAQEQEDERFGSIPAIAFCDKCLSAFVVKRAYGLRHSEILPCGHAISSVFLGGGKYLASDMRKADLFRWLLDNGQINPQQIGRAVRKAGGEYPENNLDIHVPERNLTDDEFDELEDTKDLP
jgi:hypothetical protein